MANQISYRSIIVVHFLIPLITVIAAFYLILTIFGWLFPASASTMNWHIMIPIWSMIYLHNFFKNNEHNLGLSQKRMLIIKIIASTLLISWSYGGLRTLYAPMQSFLWAFGLIGIVFGCQYLGSIFDAWRKKG